MALHPTNRRQEGAGAIIAPSILSADFGRLGAEVQRTQEAGADWIHVDVMDGHFVPNLTIGPCVVEGLRKATDLPLDVHLMIETPEKLVEPFLAAGADQIIFHIEAVAPEHAREWTGRGWRLRPDPMARRETALRARELVERIRGKGGQVGIALNPETGADWLEPTLREVDLVLAMTVWPGFGGQAFLSSMLEKIAELRRILPSATHLEVDGGLNPETVRSARAAGADVIVAGTAVFKAADMGAAIRALRQ